MALINGTSGNDNLIGTSGQDTLNGLGGNDTLNGNGNFDFIDGGSGSDTLDLRTNGNVGVDFSTGTYNGFGGSGNFINIERVLASDAADDLVGAAGGQNLSARGGTDGLEGGIGNDTLWGGTGADRFMFREGGTANADTIGDFASGTDHIYFDASAMPAIGPAGNFVAGDVRFWSSSSGTAHDADDRVIYNTTTRQILYDADGNGSGAAVLIATLQSGATLVATDIVVEGESGGPGQMITGTSGNDTLAGTDGDDTMDGFGGNDQLTGNGGADSIRGGDGNDALIAGEGGPGGMAQDFAADTLDGGLGDDHYHVYERDGDVILADPGGVDTVHAWRSSWTLGPGLENLILEDDAGVASDGTGNELDNHITSATEGGTLRGMGGNDTLVLRISENFGEAFGGDGNDTLFGGFEQSNLFGDAGNDLLVTNGVYGDFEGGTGADVFLFNSAGFDEFGPFARVLDFASSVDTLRLDATLMPALGASGRFGASDGRFVANSSGTAQDASDRVVYNTTTGDLFYDADGSGAGEGALITNFVAAPALAAADIEVVNGTPGGEEIVGTSGNDSLTGTAGDDTIFGLGGNDTIAGLSGNDELLGSAGADVLRGGEGDDVLDGVFGFSDGADTLDGGLGNDTYYFTPGDVLVDAGGTDTVRAFVDFTLAPGFENLTFSNDQADDQGLPGLEGFGNDLGNVMRAYAGDPGFLDGRGGNDTLVGGQEGDTLIGGAGNDSLDGGTGDDRYTFTVAPGAANADQISGFDTGNDKLVLDGAVHASSGASGDFAAGDARFAANSAGGATDTSDRVIYNTSTGQLWYDADGNGSAAAQLIATLQGAPALAATDISIVNGSTAGRVINGSSVNDSLAGGELDDTINGLGGNDTILGTPGNDVVDGGSGFDSFDFRAQAGGALVVDFGTGTVSGTRSATFSNIERFLTGNFNDSLTGNGAAQNLTGQAGADSLAGAGGVDTLWGGSGNDVFIFREMGSANADRVSDWASGSDEIRLDDAAFAAIGAMGDFIAGDARFKANASGTATDSSDRVVFNTSTGQLYYDADGSGGGSAQLIATVQGGASVAATDITVI
jgi:Ca2+-binding RTX toxin-like protein